MRIFVFIMLLGFTCQPVFAGARTITFPNACVKGESITIAAVGDVLLHDPLQDFAQQNSFEDLWREALPFIHSADMAYANLEGPIAPDLTRSGKQIKNASSSNSNVYTGFPVFNYPPELAVALKKSGFDIVSTANNHALDRFGIGIDKTIQTLNEADLAFTGTRMRGSDDDWVRIIRKKQFNVAWIACTAITNGIEDTHHQVLSCYNKKKILGLIQSLKPKVDAIIITPHWGEEYETQPNASQIQFAHQVLEAGASMVIGSHPHVLQPLQQYITKDGRATLIMYSMGNFVSFQGSTKKRATVVLLVGLTKTPEGTIINGVRFVPMYMQNRSGTHKLQLVCLPNNPRNEAYTAISRVMPMGNALFSTDIQTNPECHSRTLGSLPPSGEGAQRAEGGI